MSASPVVLSPRNIFRFPTSQNGGDAHEERCITVYVPMERKFSTSLRTANVARKSGRPQQCCSLRPTKPTVNADNSQTRKSVLVRWNRSRHPHPPPSRDAE